MGEEATKTIQTRLHLASGERSWLHDARLASHEIFNDTIRLKQQGYTRTEIQKEVDRDDFLRNNKCAVVGKALQTWDSSHSLTDWWENQDDPDGGKPTPPSDEGTLSWELSSWARRDIIENIEYRADCAGLAVERVYPQGTGRSCPRCGSTGHTCKSPDHQKEQWWGGHFRCDNARCGFEGDRDYIGALNMARVFFSGSDELDHGFTSSYTGQSEIVLAGRSAGTRPTFGSGIVTYEPEQVTAITGGGSAVIAPAIAVPESDADSSDGRGPVVQQCTRFLRRTTESY